MIKPLFLLMRWVQTIPLALMMLTPFEDKELRIKRGVGWLLSIAYMLLAGVLMAITSAAFCVEEQRNIIVRDLVMAGVLMVYFCCWAVIVCTPAVCKILVAVVILHYAAILNALSNVFASLILGKTYLENINADAGSMTFNFCLLATTIITWPLVWYFLRHILRENLSVLDNRQIQRGLNYICVVFFLFSAATYYPPYEIQPQISIVIGAMTVTDMIAYYIFFQEIRAVCKKETAIYQLECYQIQYQQICSRIEEVRRLRHDMRHHLITLGALNAQGKQAEIADYLKQYSAVYNQLENYKFCGDPVVESVLNYYLTQAGEEEVLVNCNAALNGSSGIDPIDMTVLLSNCLENAMEALRQLPQDKRRLDINIQTSGTMLLLQIINSCIDSKETEGFTSWENFPSSKRRERKGVGLQSITDSAEKYGGNAQFKQKDGIFTVRVVLNLP